MDDYYLIDNPPGICNQEEFDHDFKLLIENIGCKDFDTRVRAAALLKIAVENGYELNW